MKNPKINRAIGYLVMFIGFYVFYKGTHAGTAPNGVDGYDYFVLGTGILLVIVAFTWMFLKVRCPHCNGILNFKLGNIDVCPHCGEQTDI